jgi:2'-5' RNA ligase
VIAAAMAGDVERLGELYAKIEDAGHAAGFPREGRAYRPHATLARARMAMPASNRNRMTEATRGHWPGPAMTATEFVLMHSQLHPQGSRYTPLARFKIC